MPKSKEYSGYVKTFSGALGSGFVVLEVKGDLLSLPFDTAALDETGGTLSSGDAVVVTLEKADSKGAFAVESVSKVDTVSDSDEFEAPAGASSADQDFEVMMPRHSTVDSHFSKKAFIESGSRFDF